MEEPSRTEEQEGQKEREKASKTSKDVFNVAQKLLSEYAVIPHKLKSAAINIFADPFAYWPLIGTVGRFSIQVYDNEDSSVARQYKNDLAIFQGDKKRRVIAKGIESSRYAWFLVEG